MSRNGQFTTTLPPPTTTSPNTTSYNRNVLLEYILVVLCPPLLEDNISTYRNAAYDFEVYLDMSHKNPQMLHHS